MRYEFRTLFMLASISLLPRVLGAQPFVSGLTTAQQSGNILRYDCSFATSQAARGFIEYVYWDGTDSVRANTGYSDSATTHFITLMGLIPQTSYRYRAVAFDATGCYPGVWETLNVPALPQDVIVGHIVSLSGVAGDPPGYVMTNTATGSPDRFVQIHDRKGHLIWYQRMPGVASDAYDGPCQSFTYNPTTRSIFFTDCGKVTEFGLGGTVVHQVNFGSIAPGWMPHHDVYRNAAGNWLVLTAKVDTVDKSSVGGDPNALVIGPGIQEVSPTGSLLWSWSAFDHLDPLTSPGPGGDWTAKFGPQAINWLDANSVMQDGDGNPMLALGGTSQVIKVARSGANVVWTCGNDGDIEILPPDSFAVPHSLRPSRPGYYLSFDNQGLGGLSRAIEWWIDFSYITARMQISWQHTLPLADFTAEDGNIDRERNGNYMLGSRDGKSATEITQSGSTLWHAQYDSSLTRAFWVEDLYARIRPRYLGDTAVCAHDSLVLLRAQPTGGIWSGPFVHGDTFNAAAAAAGFFPITYKWGPEQFHFELFVNPAANCGVGIGEQSDPHIHFSLSPNPFSDHLDLTLELGIPETVTVEIFAMDGRALIQQDLGKVGAGKQRHPLAVPVGAGECVLVRVRTAAGRTASRLVVHE